MVEFRRLQGIASKVAFDVAAVRYGVEITMKEHGDELFFSIWTAGNGRGESFELLASVTSEERLKAHVAGFIENIT